MLSSSSPASTSSVCGALLALVAFGALLLAGCGGGAEPTDAGYALGAPLDDSTLAATAETDNYSDSLSATDFQNQMQQLSRGTYARRPDSMQHQLQRYAIDRFVVLTALAAEARVRGIEADSASVTQEIQNYRMQLQRSSGGQATLEQQLQRNGMTMADLRSFLRDQVRARALQDSLAQQAEDPTAEEIADYRTEQAREIRLEQILFEVPPRASQSQIDSVRMRARNALDSLQNGSTDFDALAQRYGLASSQAPQGNPLTQPNSGPQANQPSADSSAGYQTRAELGQPYVRQRGQDPANVPLVEAAFALGSGAVSEEPVRTQRGFHLLRRTGSRTGALMDSAQAAQELTVERRREVVQDAIEDLRENITLRVNPTYITADVSQAPDTSGQSSGN